MGGRDVLSAVRGADRGRRCGTTPFRFTSSDEGGALANSAASAREPRGACNLEGCADTADADHVGLAGDAGWGAGHDDDTVTVGDASAFG